LAALVGRGSVPGVTTTTDPYRGFRFPAEVIEHAVWLYHRAGPNEMRGRVA
jgi:hypothetical protein